VGEFFIILLFYLIGNYSAISYQIKSAPLGSHCGGEEKCRKSDSPQAENPAKQVSSLWGWQYVVMTRSGFLKRLIVEKLGIVVVKRSITGYNGKNVNRADVTMDGRYAYATDDARFD